MLHVTRVHDRSRRSVPRSVGLLLAALLCQAALARADARIIATDVAMRDGVALETFIYLPEGGGPFPTLVTRTIYGLPITPVGCELFDSRQTLTDLPAGDDDDEDDLDPAEAAGCSGSEPVEPAGAPGGRSGGTEPHAEELRNGA